MKSPTCRRCSVVRAISWPIAPAATRCATCAIRASREDLKITDEQRDKYLVRPGDKFTDYIRTRMPEKDATEWFGKAPPDLSLVARSRGTDWVFNFLTTFYADPANRQTGVNNLQLPGTAMPHVLRERAGCAECRVA